MPRRWIAAKRGLSANAASARRHASRKAATVGATKAKPVPFSADASASSTVSARPPVLRTIGIEP